MSKSLVKSISARAFYSRLADFLVLLNKFLTRVSSLISLRALLLYIYIVKIKYGLSIARYYVSRTFQI